MVREADFRVANCSTRLSGSLRSGASSWSVGSIWENLGHQPSLMNAGEGCRAVASHRDAEAGLFASERASARQAIPRRMSRRSRAAEADPSRGSFSRSGPCANPPRFPCAESQKLRSSRGHVAHSGEFSRRQRSALPLPPVSHAGRDAIRLRSQERRSKPHFYVGRTSDIHARLADHNAGRCPHTARYRPWHLHVTVELPDEGRAIAFERCLKSGSGRAFAKRHFG